MSEINKGRRKMLIAAGALAAAFLVDGISRKVGAAERITENVEPQDPQEPQHHQGGPGAGRPASPNKAVYVSKNCNVNTKKENCGKCAQVCPKKAITMVAKPKNKKLQIPVISDDLCIGCGKCVRTCPATPKALEIWNKKTNKKLM
jgi:ferredoxin